MSTFCVVRKGSLKVPSALGVTGSDDRMPVLLIRDLAKNPVWVASAVNQLKDISQDFYLQKKEIDEYQKISNNINNVINCLQTLDKCRLQLHEELEKEAITTFALYDTTKNLPLSIQVEIREAVKAAHAQNEKDFAGKTAILSELEDKICTLRDEQLRLEKNNNTLLPQRNLIRKQHDALVINLNKHLEEKSGIQINVNETKEKILQHNQQIVETEMTIQKIKADFNGECDQANRKIQGYKSDIEKVKRKKELWDKKNVRVCQELSAVNADLIEHKLALQELQKNEKIQEKSLLDLKKENQNLELRIDGEITAQKNLTNTEKKLMGTLTKLRKTCESSHNEKKKILNDEKLRFDYETKRNQELQQRQEEQQKAIVECTKAENEVKEKVKETETRLQSKQVECSEHSQSLANLDSENTQNKEAMQKMTENHSLTEAQLNREIEKRKKTLKEEKSLRFETETERDSLMKRLVLTEDQKIKYASQMNQKISELKEQFAKKSIEGREIQKNVQEKNQTLQKLDEETKAMEEELTNEAEEKEELVKQTKNTIETLEEAIKGHTKILEDKTPLFENVEKDYQKQCKIYQERKDVFSTQHRNETDLQKNVHETQKNIEEMKTMQEKQEKKIKVSHENYLSLLKSNSEESKLLEEEIYLQSCRLKSLNEKNHKLKKGVEDLEEEFVNTEQFIEESKKLQQQILKELLETKHKLTKSFKETTSMEETLNCRDTETMHQLSEVLSILNYNSQKVNNVAEQLFKHLEGLGIYLDKVRQKRTQ